MKIISKIKGFVTNSSSANYWIDSGTIRIGESSADTGQQTTSTSGILEGGGWGDFFLWFTFSIILVIVFFVKKSKERIIMLKKIFDQKTIVSLVIIAGLIVYVYINYKISANGIAGLFMRKSGGKLYFLFMVLPIVFGVIFSSRLLKDNLLIKKIKNRRLAIVLLAILISIFVCGRFFYLAGKEHKATVDYLLKGWTANEPSEIVFVTAFVLDEQDDVKIYFNNIYASASKQALVILSFIFIATTLIILILPRKRTKIYFRRLRLPTVSFFIFLSLLVNYYFYATEKFKYKICVDYLLLIERESEEPEKILEMSHYFYNIAYQKIAVFSVFIFGVIALILISLPKDLPKNKEEKKE